MPDPTGLTAAEMAYGILWRCDREPTPASIEARAILCREIGKDGQRRGIDFALEMFGPVDPMAELHRLM
jgi:hypothetical protein